MTLELRPEECKEFSHEKKGGQVMRKMEGKAFHAEGTANTKALA